jgi:chondroitin synthase
MVEDRVPVFYRKVERLERASIRKRPLVSIYVPAYNCEQYIEDCVDSALVQTISDLQVVVCDDGSSDGTWSVLQTRYRNNPRVKLLRTENRGIGAASNTAVSACDGHYIGQLDSDDRLLPDAVEICLDRFLSNPKLGLVYTTNYNLDEHREKLTPGYNWPTFSRERLTCSMIAHHFRMFTRRAWSLTSGFSEDIQNAVDYDMYLKLSEVAECEHVNKRSYIRRLHGKNTSIAKLAVQKKNHFLAQNRSLMRQGIKRFKLIDARPGDDKSRKYRWLLNSPEGRGVP